MTRADVNTLIIFNSLIRYRDDLGNEHKGIVIGDSYARFNGKFSYSITLKDPNAYSISACRLDEIVEVLDWHIPEVYRENIAERTREHILATYFKDGHLIGGVPEIQIIREATTP